MRKLLTLLFAVVALTPLQAQETTKGALLKFENAEHDFGTVSRKGADKVCIFRFVNSGDEPLVILSATTSCSCMKVNFSRKPIAPNQKGEIKLTLEARKLEKGVFHRVVQIQSTSTKGAEVLTIKGQTIEY